jgi:hypothetical protein
VNEEIKKREVKELGPFKYWNEHYFGSTKTITTISWKGKGEVDSNEVKEWCIQNFGNSGYQEEKGTSFWVDNCDSGELMLCKPELLTAFLLRWS